MHGQTIDFSFSSNSGQLCTPATIVFTQQHQGNPRGYMWDFGNGQRSNEENPQIVYNSPGNYSVKLIVVYENTTIEIVKQLVLKASTPIRITSNRTEFCTPSAVSFSLNSNPAFSGFQWNFGDNSATLSNLTTNLIHQYSNFGNFQVNVTATNQNGCQSKDSVTIRIQPPVISGRASILNGCVPATTQFQSNVILPAGSTVNSFVWNFGDGTTNFNNTGSISHTYNNAGDYTPQLTISTNDGCSAIFNYSELNYGTPPTGLISYPYLDRFCGSVDALFYAKADLADKYEWNFGFGSRELTTDTLIQHKFSSLGTKYIPVTPFFNNCPGSTDTIQVEVIGTIAKFNYQNSCDDKRTFQFNNTSLGTNLSYLWQFGNNNVTSVLPSPVFSFPRSGAHLASLITYDPISGCSDTSKTFIYTATPNLINAHDSICINTDTRFRVTNSYRNINAIFEWNLMGQPPFLSSDSIIMLRADSLGHFNNFVVIKNGSAYCEDTIHLDHSISVKGPFVSFNADTSFCQSIALQVQNLSRPFLASDTITEFKWNFGDNSPEFIGENPPVYFYNENGNYNVRLIAKDIFGCKDTLIKKVKVHPMPFLWIIPQETTVCQGVENSIIGYTSDSLIWTTSIPVTNLCNDCDSNVIIPTYSTQFFATATNQFNCVTRDTAHIKVIEPFNAYSPFADTSICENAMLQLQVYPTDKKVVWSPPNGLSSINVHNPLISASGTVLYTAELTDSLGCFQSQAQINIAVARNPVVELGNDRFLPFETPVSIIPSYSSNIRMFEWSPSQALSCLNCPNPFVTLTGTEQLTIKVTSDSGCVSTDRITLVVECNNAYLFFPTAFTPDGDGKNDKFYPFSRGIRHIRKFMIFDRYGKEMFQQTDFSPNEKSNGWDGKYKGVLQNPGAYVYVVEAICDLGQRTIKKGSFILLQ